MNKICTSIEQSKKLIELELDTNTADFKHVFCGTLHGEDIYQLELGEPNVDEECIVAWSLSALLGLMPKHIYQNDQVYFFIMMLIKVALYMLVSIMIILP